MRTPNGANALQNAIFSGCIRCVELLLAVGKVEEQILGAGMRACNSVMIAATIGRAEALQVLLDQPCAKEALLAVDEHGTNALMKSTIDGRTACIKVLLAAYGGAYAAAQCQQRNE